eukprot:8468634-Alexandrium_andersonii.AAC.1
MQRCARGGVAVGGASSGETRWERKCGVAAGRVPGPSVQFAENLLLRCALCVVERWGPRDTA